MNYRFYDNIYHIIAAHRETSAAVAFFAYRSGNLGISSRYGRTYRTIIYDRVDLNIGNAYNRHNGIVTAPYTGVYLFHVSTAVCFKSWAIIQLIQNGRIRDISMPDSSMNGGHFRNQATTSTPLYLVKGDSVYVRIGHAHAGQCIESNRDIRTSFSGVKIH